MKLSKMAFAKILKVAVIFTLIGLAGCRGIPNSFQGEYEDRGKGVWLDLYTYEATLRLPDGRKVESKLEEFKFDLLRDGKRAIYARPNPSNKDLVEIYWVQPNLSTRGEGGGMVWYEAELVYSVINSNESSVRNITLGYCPRGIVLLDTVTATPQLGCPAGAEKWSLRKTRDRGNEWPGDGGGGA